MHTKISGKVERIKHDLSVHVSSTECLSNLSYHTNMSKKDTFVISSDTPLWHQDYLLWNNLSSEWIGRIDLAYHVKGTSSPGTGLDSIWDVPGSNTLVGRCSILTQIREMRHPVDTVDSLLKKSRIFIKDPEVRVSGHGKYILVNIKRSWSCQARNSYRC